MADPIRQLAAIMFTDIVGYTALMGEDEERAMSLVEQNLKIQKPIVEKHNGQWLKEIGDGTLMKFNTALDAVNCGIEIQKVVKKDFDGMLRIGIHLGDIVVFGLIPESKFTQHAAHNRPVHVSLWLAFYNDKEKGAYYSQNI